jgi:DNA-binding response OmpR family regulator
VTKTILIVEDELDIAEALQATLEAQGYRVVLAANGREALEGLDEVRPDLAIVDVMMPVLDGRETCRLMRERPEYGSMPIVLMTAARAVERTGRWWDAFLAKPFDLDRLFAVLERLLGRSRPG